MKPALSETQKYESRKAYGKAHYGKKKQTTSEDLLFLHMKAEKVSPLPLRQYQFAAPLRKFRADFCWPDRRLIIEVEGQVHSIRDIRESDIERRQWCYFNGWTVIPISAKQVRAGIGINVVKRCMSQTS